MEWTQYIRDTDLQQLIINWQEQEQLKGTRSERDYVPVVKLFAPAGAATWLITECNDDGLAFGLCDMGFGQPELGYVSLDEIFSVLFNGLRVEQDLYFKPGKTLGQYADEARSKGRIVA